MTIASTTIIMITDEMIFLVAPEEGEITVSAADLGLKWGNREILEEAANFGRDGDILWFSC